MTQYLNLETNQLTTESEIRSANPNTSYPVPFPVPDGYALVFDAPQPAYDQYSQIVQQIAPILTNKGHYEQQWKNLDLTGDDLISAQERKVKDELAARRSLVESSLIAFAAEKDFDLNETDKMLNSGVQEWIDEATKFNLLWTQTWRAFYKNEQLPELIW